MTASDKQTSRSRPLKVRVGKSYNARYNTQPVTPMAQIVPGALTPLSRINPRWDNFTLIRPGYDLIHTFNAIPLIDTAPFIVTFEDYCPRVPPDRYNRFVEWLLTRRLIGDRCLAIATMSEYGLRKFSRQHAGTPHHDLLMAKTRVIYPGVCNTYGTPKAATDKLRLLFVGTDFFRKGGPGIVGAHRRLTAMGIPVETTIISSLRWSAGDYIGPPEDPRIASALQDLNGDGIVTHPGLPNAQVQELMAASDYLLIPTFHDTFGYVGVEAMAKGTPAIATATCAQPEIVEHGVSGYLIDFENDAELGEWAWLYRKDEPGYADAYWDAVAAIEARLTERLALAWEERRGYEALSAGAIARAQSRFGADRLARDVERLYALAG